MEKQTPLILSCSPHFHSDYKTNTAMRDVAIATCLPVIGGIYYFGISALLVVLGTLIGTVGGEFLVNKIRKQKITIGDFSAIVTGLLLACCLPGNLPVWMAVLGGLFAIVIGKGVFGGLGQNIFNPALIGRALLMASFPVQMTSWVNPNGVDAITIATPLPFLKLGFMDKLPSILDMVIGKTQGCLGETCAIAILIGGIFLIARGHVDIRIPVPYISTVFVLSLIFGLVKGYGAMYAVYSIFSGGLLLGALFMATDWVTSPITKKGRLIYGFGLGILTCLIRFFGGLAEGVCYSILLMNIVTPLIDRYTRSRIYGVSKNGK